MAAHASEQNPSATGDIVQPTSLIARARDADPKHHRADDNPALFFDIDLRWLWALMYRNRFLTLTVIAVTTLLAVAAAFLTTPVYRALMTIQIDEQAQRILDSKDEDRGGGDFRFLQTQIDVLESRSLAQQVAERLGLYRSTKFLEQMHVKPVEKPVGVYDIVQARREQVVDQLQANLKTKLPGESRVVQVAFSSPDRSLSARVVNAFGDAFIVSNLQHKFNSSSYARQFLQDQLGQTRQRLEDSERAMIAYARSAQLIDTGGGSQDAGTGTTASGPRSLTTSSLVQINQSSTEALTNRLATEQHWNAIRTTPLMDVPEVLANSTVQTLMQERAKAEANYDQEAARHKPDFPSQLQLTAQIGEYSRQIKRIATSIKDGIRQQYVVAIKRQDALQSSLQGLRANTLAEQDRSVRYNILRREVDTNRALYDALLQRYKEVSATAGITANNISIIDRASPPIDPVSPRPLIYTAAGLILGFTLGTLIALVRDKLNAAVLSPQDIEADFGMRLIGVVPMLPARTDVRTELADPRSALSEAYHSARATLELSRDDHIARTLLVTSSAASEGKSTTAFALARDFAQIGKRTLLLDCDLRNPGQHRGFDIPNTNGMRNLLQGSLSIAEVVHHSSEPNLDFIAAGPISSNPAELLSGARMPKLLQELLAIYDMIVIDGPPVLGLADAPTLAFHAQATLLVIEANRTHRGQVTIAMRRLLTTRAHIVGALLTKYDSRTVGYEADYGYSYSYRDKAGTVAT